MDFAWTPKNIELLRNLALQRLSAKAIGAEIGTTKNSVISKARREHIPLLHMKHSDAFDPAAAREIKNARKRALRAARKREKPPARPTTTNTPLPTNDVVPTEPRVDVMGMMPAAGERVEEIPSVIPPEIPALRPVRTQSGKRTVHYGAGPAHMHLDRNQCRWPAGDPRSQDFHFCTEDALDGGVYCAAHAQKHIHPNWNADTRAKAIRKG